VLHVLRKLGELVDGSAATPIAEVADLAVLEIHAQVSPAALAPLRERMPATVRVLGAAEPRTASVYRVAPAVDATTLLGLVRLRLDKSDGVAVGAAATARIAIAERPGIRVPASALRRSLVGADEVVVCDQGVARVRTVQVGVRDERGVELASGVKPGEQVVIDHVLGLEEGQALVGSKK
jgi:HlyD family secretion protein